MHGHPGICKLAHVELVTPDVDRSLWFFTRLLGMAEVDRDGSRVYLRAFNELDHHSLTLREGPTGVGHVAFRTTTAGDVQAYADRLTGLGVDVTWVSRGEERGQGDAIRFTMPHADAPIELVHEIDKPLAPVEQRSKLPTNSTRFWPTAAAVRRIDHINLSTSRDELAPAEDFAIDVLGFKRRECVRSGDGPVLGTWLSVTSQVHDLAITIDAGGRTGRLNHVAFNMESFGDVARAADVMVEHDIHIDVAPGRHGVTQGFFLYVREPGSDHRIELFAGGYQIFDPDWEPIVWDESDFAEGRHGLAFFGPRWSREHNPNAVTTPLDPAVAPPRA
jgi:catechol 2,3 dioxygenase